jgi:hypothetical protein
MTVITDLAFTAGPRFQVLMNPVLRGLINPGTQVTLRMNTLQNVFDIGGDVVLRGGEVQWFNRNFYLRSGRVSFTDKATDPHLTFRAEVRERDEEGEAVRITITAEHQRLSELVPAYSAEPAKSESEIMTLLGENVMGDVDSSRQALITGGDMVLQLTLLRRIENGLRELLKFDIFSVRATWLQNMLTTNSEVDATRSRMALGEVFNNSTVYVGKYLTNEVYFDALLHFLYDESKLISDPTSTGMVVQPEIGLEVITPFNATIRWSFAPELGSMEQLLSPAVWVPATAITLSWRRTFETGLPFFKPD